jgi:hypothetical protein
MRSKLAALAIGGTALLGVPAAASASSHVPPPAGTCTVHANYTLSTSGGSFQIVPTSDTCTGGGTVKYQAEEQCAVTQGGTLYTYGGWKDPFASSTAGDSSCTTGNGGEILDGYIRINMNNPIRVTCWVPGDPRIGTCTAHT